ncbi:hypothetical protein [Nakamurella sp.]|uniref:hypothetical protein n=1 Tax=Nakamurella sp. TaxID=1869182 RepID=UPI003B3B1B45
MTATHKTARTATDGMTGRRRFALRVLSPVLIAGAFAGLAGATDVAAAPARSAGPALASAAVHYTQGFDIRNLSSHTITLSAIDSPGRGDGAPYIGTVLRPGESLHYEKVWWFGDTPKTKLTFSDDDGSGSVRVFQMELWVDSFLKTPSIMIPYSDGRLGGLDVQGLGYTSQRATFVDPFGTSITVPDADKQRQADLLNQLCAGGQASCTFRPTTTQAGPALVSRKASEVNRFAEPLPVTVSDVFTFNASSSVEGTVSAKMTLFGLVDTTLSAKYGKTWSEGRTGTISRTFKVSPGHRGYVEVHQPTTRQYGDFTVTMGNTVWHLTNVHFDIPDMSRTPDVVSGEERI